MTEQDILFHTPLWVLAAAVECDDVPTLLANWKEKFLKGECVDVWEGLARNQKSNAVQKAIAFARTFIKWTWPTLLLGTIAYFSSPSAFWMAIVFVPIQLIITFYMTMKFCWLVCIIGAHLLETQ